MLKPGRIERALIGCAREARGRQQHDRQGHLHDDQRRANAARLAPAPGVPSFKRVDQIARRGGPAGSMPSNTAVSTPASSVKARTVPSIGTRMLTGASDGGANPISRPDARPVTSNAAAAPPATAGRSRRTAAASGRCGWRPGRLEPPARACDSTRARAAGSPVRASDEQDQAGDRCQHSSTGRSSPMLPPSESRSGTPCPAHRRAGCACWRARRSRRQSARGPASIVTPCAGRASTSSQCHPGVVRRSF